MSRPASDGASCDSSWYFPRKRNSIQDLMGTKSAASIISLRKSLSGLNLAKEKEKQDEVESVNSYESFMKKHLSHFGYYSSTSKSSTRRMFYDCEYDPRLGANEADDFTHRGTEDDFGLSKIENQEISSSVDDLLTRTKQIIVDQDTGARLKEPRGLYSIGNYGQEAKFPNHVQVALETPQTLDCEPETQHELLYENRGDEPKPEPRATLSQCVYFNDPGPDNYFIRSRARGKKPVNLPVPSGANTLIFESRFESGNLLRASKVGEYEYELELRTDLYTNRHTQWFYFQIKNTRPDVNYRFTIINFSKPSSLYNNGLRPLMYSKHMADTRGKGWVRNGENIRYYRRAMPTSSGRSQYCLTWTMKLPHNNDTVYLAHDYPYTYTDLQQYLDTLTTDTTKARFIKTRILCRSLAQNFVHILTITNPHETLEAKQKKVVVISARVHPGETNGSWMMKGFLDFITSMEPDAVTLRGHFIFKVIPMLNPDGVIVGNYRCSLAGRDLNRRYKTTLREAFPAIYALTRNVQIFQKEHEVAFYIDLHGHSRKHNVFMYGCQSIEQPGLEKVFPYMMSLNAPGIFKFESCKYKTQANKEGTGRVFMHRLGVKNSFTMEASFGGSTLGSRVGTHLGIKDLERMGRHICDTLLDFYDPDPAKIQYCRDEISQKLREKLVARYGEDQIPTDPQLLHDFESDTSGSNSSSDEGLPAHLAEEHQKRKKTWKKRQPKKSESIRPDRSQRAKSAEDASKLLKNVKARPPRPTPSNTSNGNQRSDNDFNTTTTKKNAEAKERILVPLRPNNPLLMQFGEGSNSSQARQQNKAASTKTIVNLAVKDSKAEKRGFTGRRKAHCRVRSSINTSSSEQTGQWHTVWGDHVTKSDAKTESFANPRQTKFQGLSIETYLKHLLKVRGPQNTNKALKPQKSEGALPDTTMAQITIGQLLSTTRGASSSQSKRKLIDIIDSNSTLDLALFKDQFDVQTFRELLQYRFHDRHPNFGTTKAPASSTASS